MDKANRLDMQRAAREAAKGRVLRLLTQHVGRANAIDMGELYRQVYGQEWSHKINDTRALRGVITELRRHGAAIGSVSSRTGGGYYLMSGSELVDWMDRVKIQAIRKLGMLAKLKRKTLPELLGQIAVEAADLDLPSKTAMKRTG